MWPLKESGLKILAREELNPFLLSKQALRKAIFFDLQLQFYTLLSYADE